MARLNALNGLLKTDWQQSPITAILPSSCLRSLATEEEGHNKESHDQISINFINLVKNDSLDAENKSLKNKMNFKLKELNLSKIFDIKPPVQKEKICLLKSTVMKNSK